MARFLTPEWVEELNAVLDGLPVPDPGPDAGLAMADGRVTVVQEVHGTPDGDVSLVLQIEADAVHLSLERSDRHHAGGRAPTVTIAVSYQDAAAMNRGELSPAEALNAGRIRVRGDLAALAAAQHILNSARARVDATASATTY